MEKDFVCKVNNHWEYIADTEERASKNPVVLIEIDEFFPVFITDRCKAQVLLLRHGNKYGLYTGHHTAGMGGPGTWCNPSTEPFPFDDVRFYADPFKYNIPALFAFRKGSQWGVIEVIDGEAETDERYETVYPLTKSRLLHRCRYNSLESLETKMGLQIKWGEFGDEKYEFCEDKVKVLSTEHYLKMNVPIKWDADWFRALRAAVDKECGKEHVKWQRGNYHITVSFFKNSHHVEALTEIFNRIMHGSVAQEITFDEVNAFVTRDGKEIIVNLTASKPTAAFNAFVDRLRKTALKTGAEMEPDFCLHVTLGRIATEKVAIEDATEVAESIEVPAFTLTLNELEYRYRPNPIIRFWRLPPKNDYREINRRVMIHTERQYETLPVLMEAVMESKERQFMVMQEENIDLPAAQYSQPQYITSPRRTFEAAKLYKGKKVAVLNFANNHHVGGAPFSAGAQEESLCRCSTLYPCLQAMYEDFYLKHKREYDKGLIDAMGSDDLIYTPDVVVFKTDERTDPVCPCMMYEDEWYKVDVITCAAPELMQMRRVPSNYEELITRRIKKILDVAAKERVEVLILGAWGCGAFCNDIKVVSRAFYTLLENYDFETVEFALGSTRFHEYFPKGTVVE